MSRTLNPIPVAVTARPTETLREFTTYEEAQALVDRLSDAGFPVERLRIVGTGIRSVEQVTGRLTTGRATAGGAFTGAWFGVLMGLILSLFTIAFAWPAVLLGSLIVGAIWGAVLGFVVHWATGGRRDFSSVHGLAADRYGVQVDAGYEAEAARVAGIA
jgi:hypothetical protein